MEGPCLIGAFLFVDSWPAMFVTDHVPVNRRKGPRSKDLVRLVFSGARSPELRNKVEASDGA